MTEALSVIIIAVILAIIMIAKGMFSKSRKNQVKKLGNQEARTDLKYGQELHAPKIGKKYEESSKVISEKKSAPVLNRHKKMEDVFTNSAPNQTLKKPNRFSKESVRPLLDEIHNIRSTNARSPHLDEFLGERIKVSRVIKCHGTDNRVLQIHLWDGFQLGPFLKDHFKYEVQYDPINRYACKNRRANFAVQFYMNKIRLPAGYERKIISRIIDGLKDITIPGFYLDQNEQAIFFIRTLKIERIEEAVQILPKLLVELISKVHPVYSSTVDWFTTESWVKGAQRKSPKISIRNKYQELSSEYAHNIPFKLREQVLERDKYRCRFCSRTNIDFHIDHIIPHSRGGLTVISNLQTLCSKCNLKKSNKLIEDK